jgi:hypothetical protein
LSGTSDLEEPRHGFVQLSAAIALRQLLDLGRVGDLDVDHRGEAAATMARVQVPWPPPRRGFAPRSPHPACRAEAERLAQELAPHDIRDRRGVRLAVGMQLVESGDRVAQRFEQSRLADPGVTDNFDQATRAGARTR